MTYRKAIKEADKWFSKYIRLRDSKNGIGTCITCHRKKDWKYMDCGHYIKRQHISTRYDEQNCNIQCKHCNAFEQGANEKYKVAIDIKYGKGVADELELKKQMRAKLSTKDLLFIADYYKSKFNDIQRGENEKM
jgi:hypothetical protein